MTLPLLEQTAELQELSPLPRLPRSSVPYSRVWAALLVFNDALVFCAALFLAGLIGYSHHIVATYLPKIVIYDAVYVLLWLLIFERLGLYRKTAALTAKDELYFTVAALTIGVVPQLLLFTAIPTISSSRIVLLYALVFSILGAGISRTVLHSLRKSGEVRRARRIAIVGSPERIEQVRDSMANARASTLLVPIENIDRDYNEQLSGDLAEHILWLHGVFAWKCDTIVFADIPPPRVIPHLLEAAALHQVRIAFAPPRIRRQSYGLSLEIDGNQALIVPERLKACTPRARLVKRIMDVVLASIALLIFSPIMTLCALAILLEDGRPIFYRQQRIGQNGRVFEILKFRSMRTDAEADTGAVWAKAGDGRCTHVGAFLRRMSFDEFPQLINVLRGDMSLVGPRPERPIFVEAFRQEFPRYDERHLVRPGISGLSQMKMRRVLTTSDVAHKLTFDLYYLEEWSIFMDISLLIRTAAEFLFQRAA
jgi:exopolysaccharide biosynthesis polyprenyl glycosylphosphotransferase